MTNPQTTEEMVELQAWPFFGYAPGSYMASCYRCGETKADLDKRAICCLECAVKHAKRYIAEFASIPPQAEIERLREALEGLVRAVEKDANEDGKGISGYTGARLSDARAALTPVSVSPCQHEFINEGPRIPLRYGSAATDICTDCHSWRQQRDPHSRWHPASELAEAFTDNEEARVREGDEETPYLSYHERKAAPAKPATQGSEARDA